MEEKKEIQIELSAEVAEGIYSNLAIISHAPSEFVIDFIRMTPGAPKAPVKSRPSMPNDCYSPCRTTYANTKHNSGLYK